MMSDNIILDVDELSRNGNCVVMCLNLHLRITF